MTPLAVTTFTVPVCVGGVCECLSTISKCTEHDPPLCVWGRVECEVGGVGGVCECLSTTTKCTEHDPPTLTVLTVRVRVSAVNN